VSLPTGAACLPRQIGASVFAPGVAHRHHHRHLLVPACSGGTPYYGSTAVEHYTLEYFYYYAMCACSQKPPVPTPESSCVPPARGMPPKSKRHHSTRTEPPRARPAPALALAPRDCEPPPPNASGDDDASRSVVAAAQQQCIIEHRAQTGRRLLPVEPEPGAAAVADIDALTAALVARGFSSERARAAAICTAGRGFASTGTMDAAARSPDRQSTPPSRGCGAAWQRGS
jgi:hypothetical protein